MQDVQSYQQTLILPNVIRLIQPKRGERILDCACGQGLFSSAFFKAGARVIGIDSAPALIRIAQERYGLKTVSRDLQFCVSSAEKMTHIHDESIDTVVIILALQNIKNVARVFSECARVLTQQGRLFFVINHPAFRIPRASGWGWDTKKKVQYRRVDQYLSETHIPIQMHPGRAQEQTTISFHRPLQSYMKALRTAGFALTNFEEWISHKMSNSGPRAPLENRARKEFPLFLCVEARKIRV